MFCRPLRLGMGIGNGLRGLVNVVQEDLEIEYFA